MSTYSKVNNEWGNNQLLLIELKDTTMNPLVWRISPTYNNYQGGYRDEGSAALSHDGKSIFVTANWGTPNGHGEVYQFLLPDSWYEHFPGSLHPDTIPPTVTSFNVLPVVGSLQIPISAFVATDKAGVTGYLVSESSTAPLSNAIEWSPNPPTNYSVATYGTKVLYAWAKDAAGNISASKSATVSVVQDTTPPTLTINAVPSTTISANVNLSGTTSDNVAMFSVSVQVGIGTPAAATLNGSDWAYTASNLPMGLNTITVTARDTAGITVTKTISITRLYAGAANTNGTITISDALLALRYALGLEAPTPEQLVRSDVAPLGSNGTPLGNGVIDAADVILLLRRSIGIGIGSW